MKALEDIWNDRRFEREMSYTDNLALMLQPNSFSDFHAHSDFAEVFRLWTQKDTFRGLDVARLWSLVLNAKYALSKCKGAVAELGVYQGQSSAVLSFYAREFGRKMYIADTFQGFAEQQYEEGLGDAQKAAFKDISVEAARNVVGDYAGNRWVVGVFPNSITKEMNDDVYAFVSIDCDIYEPIAEGLEFFWPRMVPGGIIFIHDYSSGYWPGATRAVDGFCASHGIAGSLLPDLSGSYVLTRPGTVSSDIGQSDAGKDATADIHSELNYLRAHVEKLEQTLRALQNSRSWILTKPLRMVNGQLRKLVSGFRNGS